MRERGSATVEFVWLALLLLVPLVYVLLAVFDVQRTAFGLSSASRAAARAYVTAPDARAADARAQAAAVVVLADHHVHGATVTISCSPTCRVPGSWVRVDIRVTQALPLTPSVFGDQIAPMTVSGRHTEPYGSYRDTL